MSIESYKELYKMCDMYEKLGDQMLKQSYTAAPPPPPPMTQQTPNAAAAGGMPPQDPNAMGAMPPQDPNAMGAMPPQDPNAAAGGMPPQDPNAMGAMPPQNQNVAPQGGPSIPPELESALSQLASGMTNVAGEVTQQRDQLNQLTQRMLNMEQTFDLLKDSPAPYEGPQESMPQVPQQ